MIKKTVTAIVAVLLAVAFISCDSGGGGDDGYSAPSVMSIEDLPASDATVFPNSGTEQKAIDLFANAIKALSNEVDLDTDYELDGDTITYSIDETAQDGNGGLLTYKGFAESTSKYSYDDDNFTPELNKTYKDFITTKTTVELDTEVNNYTLKCLDFSGYERITLHIRGGESKERMKSSTDFTLTIGSSTSEIDFEFDFSVSSAYSAAYSMTDEDGFGGKFIVQFSEDFKDSVDLESLYEGEDAIYDELASTEATLEVYNDSNELVLTTKVPASKLMKGSSNF